MNIFEMLFIDTLLTLVTDEKEKTEKEKKSDKVDTSSIYGKFVKDYTPEPAIVDTYDKKMIVTFDESDKVSIIEFNKFLESESCTFELDENVFIINAENDVLYDVLLVLTNLYNFIKIM